MKRKLAAMLLSVSLLCQMCIGVQGEEVLMQSPDALETEFASEYQVTEAEQPETEQPETEQTETTTETEYSSEAVESDTENNIEEKETERIIETEALEAIDDTDESEAEETEVEDERETETETEAETETETETEEVGEESMLLNASLTASGVSVLSSNAWKLANIFSADYRPLKFYTGISSMEYFVNSSKVVLGTSPEGKAFLYPTAVGQEGTFGAVYHKVLYNEGRWYDLKLTVDRYSDYALDAKGKKIKSFPMIMMEPNRISWKFSERMGEVVLKCEILDASTGENAAVNTRFQWWDIDAGQRFGILPVNGSVAGRYYYGGSKIHYQTGQTIAGKSGFEVVVAPAEESDHRDPKYCAVFELNQCSTYYMAFPYLDHHGTSGYSMTENSLTGYQSALAQGKYGSNMHDELLVQTDAAIGSIDTPAPEKSVSPDRNSWFTDIELQNPSEEYWYKLEQYIPWQDVDYFYSLFTVKDELEEGVEYRGDLSVIRVEDQEDVTNEFDVLTEGQQIQVSAKAELLASGKFYGYHYAVVFKASIKEMDLVPKLEKNKVTYSVKNSGSIIYRHGSGEDLKEKNSNEVTTNAVRERKNPERPVKGIDDKKELTQKDLHSMDDEVVFTIYQVIPENEKVFWPENIIITDVLEDCFEGVSAEVELKKNGDSEFIKTDVKTVIEGQNVKAVCEFLSEYNGGELLMRIHCRIRKNADLTKYQKNENGASYMEMKNLAEVEFEWKKDEETKQQTNEVGIIYREGKILIEKEILAEDIVWAHGQPTFTVIIEGKDLQGNTQRYTRILTFAETETPKTGSAVVSTEISVGAGEYTVKELPVIRYELKQITNVKGGTIQGQTVVLDLSQGGNGSVRFVNKKVNDEGCSDTSYVCNRIG